ncbi:MAG: tetratricopeptide repeat protein, partial [candidate division Zixibacteria bacterium]|nr:tetratricopeptide repeat protein [candidate division Zixibacteria bacterium]
MKKNRRQQPRQPQPTEPAPNYAYVWPLVGIILLNMVGALVPDYLFWGFNYWSLISRPLALGILILALVLVLPRVSRTAAVFIRRAAKSLSGLLPHGNRLLTGSVVSLAVLTVLYVFRSKAHVYGDGISVLGATDVEGPLFHGQGYLQMLAIVFHRLWVAATGAIFGLEAEPAFALANCVGGVVALWAIFLLSRALTQSTGQRWLVLVAALSSGSIIRFFGYIENYTWAAALGLWSLYYSVRVVQSRTGAAAAFVSALLAAAFHLIALPYLAVAALAWWLRRRTKQLPLPPALKPTLLIALVSLAAVALLQLTPLAPVFVPFWPKAQNPYWLLSGQHIRDVLNLAILVAPLGVMTLIYMLISRRFRIESQPEEKLLATTVVLFGLAAFWINPELGAVRDWDLLAYYGIPFSMLAALMLSRIAGQNAGHAPLVFGMVIVALVHVVPNLMEKNNPAAAVARLDDYLWQDAHYQENCDQASRCLAWGYLLRTDVGDIGRARKYFERRLRAKEDSDAAWVNLGQIYFDGGQYDSAAYCLARANSYLPNDASVLNKLANAEMNCGRPASALEFARQAEILEPDDASIQTTLGTLLYRMQQYR